MAESYRALGANYPTFIEPDIRQGHHGPSRQEFRDQDFQPFTPYLVTQEGKRAETIQNEVPVGTARPVEYVDDLVADVGSGRLPNPPGEIICRRVGEVAGDMSGRLCQAPIISDDQARAGVQNTVGKMRDRDVPCLIAVLLKE